MKTTYWNWMDTTKVIHICDPHLDMINSKELKKIFNKRLNRYYIKKQLTSYDYIIDNSIDFNTIKKYLKDNFKYKLEMSKD